jgi:hypothetical protein
MTESPVELSVREEEDWKLAYDKDALVVTSGLVYLQGKKHHGLRLDELLNMMREHPESHYYSKTIRHRVSLGQALQSNRFEELGRETDMVAAIDLSSTHDRVFDPCPRTGGELLAQHQTSHPYRVPHGNVTK